jgi:hypothetical protein
MSHISRAELIERISSVDTTNQTLGKLQWIVTIEALEQPGFLLSSQGIYFVVPVDRVAKLPTVNEKLRSAYAAAALQVHVGEEWAHNKHPDQPYTIIALAALLYDGDASICVVYEDSVEPQISWARPINSFLGLAEKDTGEIVDRFIRL